MIELEKKMGISFSRVCIKFNAKADIGQIEEGEGMVTVNYEGGKVPNQTNQPNHFCVCVHCALQNVEMCRRPL